MVQKNIKEQEPSMYTMAKKAEMSLFAIISSMIMLRDWNGESHTLITHTLEQFGLHPKEIFILKYECLTPDCFIWFFSADGKQYCLYAEDYVPTIQHALTVIHDNLPHWMPNNTYKLLEVTNRQNWSDASPVKSASTYKSPKRPEEFMKFAATSGFDFVFLAQSDSKPKTNLD